MPKFSKDQVQKSLFVVIAGMALLYAYSEFVIGPLMSKRKSMTSSIGEFENKLVTGAKAIQEAAALEGTARGNRARFAQDKKNAPTGALVAWFPPVLKSFFAQEAIPIDQVRLLNAKPFESGSLKGYVRSDWIISIPEFNFGEFGPSLARLENERENCSISSLRIRAIPEHPDLQSAILGLVMLSKE